MPSEVPMLKYRFRWREYGADHETTIEAASFPEACFALGAEHAARLISCGRPKIPPDFELNLSKPEIVQ